jgi:cell division protein FtsB
VGILPAIGAILGGIGAVLAVYANLRGQKGTVTQDKLSLAWDMQEKQLDMLVADKNDLTSRVTILTKQVVDLERDLAECKEGRRQLEIQVELLKLRGTNG